MNILASAWLNDGSEREIMDTKNHDEALRRIVCKNCLIKDCSNHCGAYSWSSKVLVQIRDAGFIHKSEIVLDEGKMLKVLSILNRTTMFVTDKMRVHALAQAGINELGKE